MSTSERTSERLQGFVERITFHNPDSGFCVLRVKVQGVQDLVAVVANVPSIAAGEYIECLGDWNHDKTYGRQFKCSSLTFVPPNTLEGIEKYLGSGLVKGVGSHTAKILMKAFGENVLTVLDNEPERLLEVAGIGKKKQKQISRSWNEQKAVRDIMVFMQSHGLGTARAARIYKAYGEAAITKVSENPYRLILDIQGIGFKIADTLAMRLGIASDSIVRARAGVRHVLQGLCDHGHCAALYPQLVQESVSLLEINEEIIQSAIEKEIAAGNLIREVIPINVSSEQHAEQTAANQHHEETYIFLAPLYYMEKTAAQHLLRILDGDLPWGQLDVSKAIPWVEQKTGLQLAASQQQAIEQVLNNKLTIMTGGPGVGKTTVVNSILKILQAKCLSIALCAPTGRAAKRLTETTGVTGKTIHRLLAFSPETRAFKHNQDNPLPIDVLIVDEASMIDIGLLHQLLKAIPDRAALLFVGDVDQLPSVGPGAVLLDMMRSGLIPVVRLTEIFRQATHSKIIVNAHRINQGEMPLTNDTADSDFYVIYVNSAEEIHDQLLELIAHRLPQYLGCHPIADIQLLTPMNRGGLGTIALNASLQAKLNRGGEPKIVRYGFTFALGDKVIQTVNNYDKEVFNGDIGFITRIDLEENIVHITFDQRVVKYGMADLDEINLAYAISIHKSQGSEFPVVVMPIAIQHHMLLARNLLYTGVTRGKRLVVLVGEKRAIAMAVANNRENTRLTRLAYRMNAK
ncbi:MAG TPA: ATP-dependent RecD-like DNA helicase [Gammaproteobacteria bacterium]|jgi:exodeoxyribonuclease V alpha subunit|nr:ATP-dependent RecD-like DNA helicase [Gammaproteobacteria bacterium]